MCVDSIRILNSWSLINRMENCGVDSDGSECGPVVVSFENDTENALLVTTAEFLIQLNKQEGILYPLKWGLAVHEDQFEHNLISYAFSCVATQILFL